MHLQRLLLISHLLVELVQELVELRPFLLDLALLLSQFPVGEVADAEAEDELEHEYHDEYDLVRLHHLLVLL